MNKSVLTQSQIVQMQWFLIFIDNLKILSITYSILRSNILMDVELLSKWFLFDITNILLYVYLYLNQAETFKTKNVTNS